MVSDVLIERYHRALQCRVEVVDMDATALAGYYLCTFPKDPISALFMDVRDLTVSNVRGEAAKVVILAALSKAASVDRR